MANGIFKRMNARLHNMNHLQRIFVLLLVGAMIYGSFILADGLVIRPWLDSSFGPTPDLHIYQERTSLILNGGIIYRDLDIESPPLINYILLPPQIAGGDWWAYETYFSLFPIMTGLALYFIMRRWDEYYAFLAALLIIVCPFAVQDATWGIQDEPLVAFFYVLPVLLMLYGLKKWSAVAVAVGFWTKFLPVIIYPVTLVKLRGRKERLVNIGVAVLTSALIALPFLLVCPIEFLGFPSYYLLGRSGEGSAGMSIINLVGKSGLVIPGLFGAGITVGVLALSYYLVYRWKLDIWRGAMLSTVMFLTVYPMIRLGYFILPFVFFSVWAVRHRDIALRLIPMYVALLFGQGLEKGGPGLDFTYSWVVALVLVAIGILFMLDIAWRCLKKECFLDKMVEKREGPRSALKAPSTANGPADPLLIIEGDSLPQTR